MIKCEVCQLMKEDVKVRGELICCEACFDEALEEEDYLFDYASELLQQMDIRDMRVDVPYFFRR